ncbi:acyltransferase family protein [Curtobacterium citreum]|uniref:acyltransferase family protein n=1 Tax=Curtobacterium citreum TaxID=2036 RepID=UPI002543C541|nr:acyltransferase [Curtobacterium citreum]WIJ46175.1 acyltransferase [Curtobacterium citreum]
MLHTRNHGLDALRGVAIALVLIRHLAPEAVGGAGIVGVVIFFTLSGFLITDVLRRDILAYGRVRYTRFYRNRAIRLVPALVVVMAGIVLVILVVDPLNDRDQLLRTVIVGFSYSANIPFDHGSQSIGHFWTLATEEQFYLVWPVLLLLGARFRRQLGLVVAAGIGIFALSAVALAFKAPDFADTYTYPVSWTATMTIGAAANIASASWERWLRTRRPRLLFAVLVVVCLALGVYPDLKGQWWAYLIAAPIMAVGFALAIVWMWSRPVGNAVWLRPFVFLGTVSYAAYLWNYPLTVWLENMPWGRAIALVLSLVAATLSWYLVERPFHRLRARIDARARAHAGNDVRDGRTRLRAG